MNGFIIACINCSRLGRCSETKPDKLLTYSCPDWEVEKREEVQARVTVLERFGPTAASVLVDPTAKEDD